MTYLHDRPSKKPATTDQVLLKELENNVLQVPHIHLPPRGSALKLAVNVV